jgi:hypothetical protein
MRNASKLVNWVRTRVTGNSHGPQSQMSTAEFHAVTDAHEYMELRKHGIRCMVRTLRTK